MRLLLMRLEGRAVGVHLVEHPGQRLTLDGVRGVHQSPRLEFPDPGCRARHQRIKRRRSIVITQIEPHHQSEHDDSSHQDAQEVPAETKGSSAAKASRPAGATRVFTRSAAPPSRHTQRVSHGLPPSIRRLTVDYENRRVEVETEHETLAQGLEHAHGVEQIRRASYEPASREMSMLMITGQTVTVEVHDPELTDQASGRPVVYLDQCHWINLARSVFQPDKVTTAAELSASNMLLDLAKARRIILPISSGHALESTQTVGRWREHLAATMIGTSRGWQMRHPLKVRRDELLKQMVGYMWGSDVADSAPPVFTLEPNQMLESHGSISASDLPPEVAYLTECLSSISAIFATLVEDESFANAEGRHIATAWADSHANLAQLLSSDKRARAKAREITLGRVISDLHPDIAAAFHAACLSDEDAQDWLLQAETSFPKMPSLGYMREAIHVRLMNAGDNWVRNDLVDMVYLSCAAGYADVVVAEKKAGDYLKRAGRTLGRPTEAITTSLAQAVSRLDGMLPSTA